MLALVLSCSLAQGNLFGDTDAKHQWSEIQTELGAGASMGKQTDPMIQGGICAYPFKAQAWSNLGKIGFCGGAEGVIAQDPLAIADLRVAYGRAKAGRFWVRFDSGIATVLGAVDGRWEYLPASMRAGLISGIGPWGLGGRIIVSNFRQALNERYYAATLSYRFGLRDDASPSERNAR